MGGVGGGGGAEGSGGGGGVSWSPSCFDGAGFSTRLHTTLRKIARIVAFF